MYFQMFLDRKYNLHWNDFNKMSVAEQDKFLWEYEAIERTVKRMNEKRRSLRYEEIELSQYICDVVAKE